MDDPGACNATRVTELLKMKCERGRECTRPMSFGWMHHHSRRLVDDDDRIVFEQNIERDIFGDWTIFGRRWQQIDCHLLSSEYFECRLHWSAINANLILNDDLA